MKLVKYLRLEAGIGQGELARVMGTTQPALSAWENGKGTMPEARRKSAFKALRKALSRDFLIRAGVVDLDRDAAEFFRRDPDSIGRADPHQAIPHRCPEDCPVGSRS